MSTWGTHRFREDVLRDWLGWWSAGGLGELRQTLSRVAEADIEALGADDAARALTAAEVVAAMLDRSPARLPPELFATVIGHAASLSKADGALARRAVRRLRRAFELDASWPTCDGDALRRDLVALEARLQTEEDSTVGAPVPPVAAVRRADRQLLLSFLRARGLVATASELARIEWCTDPTQMRRWLLRAMTADSVARVLEG